MSQKNRRRSPGSILSKLLKVSFLAILIVLLLGAGSLGIAVLNIIRDAPDISTEDISTMLTENSIIVDGAGRQLEMIQTEEFRRIIEIDEMPDHLRNAVISVEDERFYTNMGVDPQGIVKSAIDNFRAGDIVRGGSTITQQLVKLMYLSDEQTIERKLKEAYMAIQLTETMPKDKILEAYLNRIFLGQGAYGVEAAAQIYFSKSAEELTVGQSAALASIINSPSNNALYKTISPSSVSDEDRVVGEILIDNQKYIAVYNPDQEDRRRYVLSNMLEQEYITQEEYDAALAEDLFAALDPPERKTGEVSSYFTDYVKEQVLDKLQEQLGYSREEAVDKLYNGGLVITATIDVEMQQKLDTLYDQFTELLLGVDNISGWSEPGFIRWNLSDSGNILNQNGRITYFHKDNLMQEDGRVYLTEGSYFIDEAGLTVQSDKMAVRNTLMDISDFFTRSDENNLTTHRVGGYEFGEDEILVNEDDSFTITKAFLDENDDFYEIDEEGRLLISTDYYSYDEVGVLQPQVTTVIMDHSTGQIKAMRGGRGTTGSSILNRATQSPRHPGSTMKPIATYLPALDNGYTAASPIDDVPYYNENNERWPTNWDFRYQGIVTLRRSIIGSMNVNAVRTLENVGLQNSMRYLEKMHLIDAADPENDNFVTREEDPNYNDENLASVGLGSMIRGFTNLELTSAYNTIANNGTYVEPIAFSKIEDTQGNLILENVPERTEVVSEQTAFIMKDILRNLTDASVIQTVQMEGIDTAGKTGTSGTSTTNIDSWFVGFTPYLSAGVWIGADDPSIYIDEVASYAVRFWGIIMRSLHEDYEDARFQVPDGVIQAEVCTQSGKKPTAACYADQRGTVRTEYFVKGTEPVEDCDAHVIARVDRSTNLLATQFCPEDLIVNRGFVKRPHPYDPAENEGILPDDWAYSVPTKYCNVHTKPAVTEPPATEPAETEDVTTEPPDTDTPITDPPDTEDSEVTTEAP